MTRATKTKLRYWVLAMVAASTGFIDQIGVKGVEEVMKLDPTPEGVFTLIKAFIAMVGAVAVASGALHNRDCIREETLPKREDAIPKH